MNNFSTKYHISISGLNLHHIISYFEHEKFKIKDIKREDKTLSCVIRKKDFLKFKKSPLFSSYNVSILNIQGLDSFFSWLTKKIGLILGITICLLSTLNITNKIQSITIISDGHTCQNKDDCIFNEQNINKIHTILKENNIYEGATISSLPQSKNIEQILMKEFKQVSGVNLTRRGVFLYIDIIEGTLLNPSTSNKLIAEENGVILNINVTSGKQLVKPGDIVLRGDTLVEQENNNKVVATATIRSFYHETTIYNENQIKYLRTGKSISLNDISLFGLQLTSSNKNMYNLYESETNYRYAFLNLFLPIKIKETIFYELKKNETIIPFEDVSETTKEDLKSLTLKQIPSTAQIINTTYSTHQEGSRTRLDCYIETHLTISK